MILDVLEKIGHKGLFCVDPETAHGLSIKALKEAMEKDDPERIRARSQDLTEAAMKLGEAIYKSQQEAEAGAAPQGEATGSAPEDDVVDADFEEIDEDDDKKKSA